MSSARSIAGEARVELFVVGLTCTEVVCGISEPQSVLVLVDRTCQDCIHGDFPASRQQTRR